jgi:hypothetical protein
MLLNAISLFVLETVFESDTSTAKKIGQSFEKIGPKGFTSFFNEAFDWSAEIDFFFFF